MTHLKFASFSDKHNYHFIISLGSSDACTDQSPFQPYSKRGDTEYSKLRINTRNLVVDTTDFTFSRHLGPNKIR